MRTILWYLHFFFTLLIKFFTVPYMKKFQKTASPEEFAKKAEELTGDWAYSQIKMSGGRIHIEGMENIPKDQAVLFVANHQSNFDVAIFLGSIRVPKGYIAKIETLKIPFVPTWMRYIRCVFIDRNDMRQQAKSILEGINILKSGHSLVVFPEGTRSKGGPVGEFKSGSFKLATKAKVPVVPVTINGSYLLMEANRNIIKPADVYVTIHPLIETKGMTKEEENELCDKTKRIIESSLS